MRFKSNGTKAKRPLEQIQKAQGAKKKKKHFFLFSLGVLHGFSRKSNKEISYKLMLFRIIKIANTCYNYNPQSLNQTNWIRIHENANKLLIFFQYKFHSLVNVL